MLIEKETKEKVKNDYNEGKIKCRIKTYLTGKVKMLNFRGGGQSTWSSHWIRVCISIYRTAVTYMLKYIYHFSFNLIYIIKNQVKIHHSVYKKLSKTIKYAWYVQNETHSILANLIKDIKSNNMVPLNIIYYILNIISFNKYLQSLEFKSNFFGVKVMQNLLVAFVRGK